MSPAASPRTTVPLWPLPLLAAVMPFGVGHLSWWLSVNDGLIPHCNLYWDGCVSISRAARFGLGNHLFRLVMLPCATVQVLCWLGATLWLRRCTPARVRMLPWLGLLAGLFLALYATFLGTDGRAYEAMRRYGISLYFAFTYFALLATLHALSQSGPRTPGYRSLLVVALGFMALGVASVTVRYTVSDALTLDRWENTLEWHLGLWLTAMFAVLAWRWWREDIRIGLEQGG